MIHIKDKQKFREVCEKSDSMAKAAAELGLHFNTFRRHAIKLGCYKPNQGWSKGKKIIRSEDGSFKYYLKDILDGKHPYYQSWRLVNRLFSENIRENKCEICGISKWNGEDLRCELNHIDGDRTNHSLENLQIICPNCHSQTKTFRARNKSLNREIC